MYCSSCGVAVPQGLSYCNYCGAKLNRDESVSKPEVRAESLIFGMLAVFVFGLIAISILMGVMKNVLGLPVEHVLGFALLPFLIMLLLEGVFIRLLLRNVGAKQSRNASLPKDRGTNELDSAKAAMLPEAMASVTEHTTRAFEPVYRERK